MSLPRPSLQSTSLVPSEPARPSLSRRITLLAGLAVLVVTSLVGGSRGGPGPLALLRPAGAPLPPVIGQQPVEPPQGRVGLPRVQRNCYPVGDPAHNGLSPNADCIEPGFEDYAHWGNEPYYNTSHRYVWVVDELGPGRARQWLQYIVAQYNALSSGNQRPTFLYYTAEDLGISNYSCSLQMRQIIEVCPLASSQNGGGSMAVSPIDGAAHFQWSHVYVNRASTEANNDYWIENAVGHEWGHMIGFAHDTDCVSIMTYCQVHQGHEYQWYTATQTAIYVYLYDTHSFN